MSIMDKRVQIYLPTDQYKGILRLAKEKHASFAQVVREAVGGLLRENRNRWEHDRIGRHVGVFESKDKDLSSNHDRYLYDA